MSNAAVDRGIASNRPVRPFNAVIAWICRHMFASVRMAPSAVEHLRSLADKGSLVYVMRQRSWVDYVLVTSVLMREGLPTPEFANDLSPLWFRSWREVLANLWQRLRAMALFTREIREFEEHARCQRLVMSGRPVLIFMRRRMSGVRLLAGRRRALTGMRPGSEYLRQIVHQLWDTPQEVALVPLAVIRGRGMRRKESRLATLVYSVQEFPSELRRIVSLLWNVRDTSISVGGEVQLGEFVRTHQREGEERLVRRLSRALQLFLYREERIVWGPPLLPKRQVRQRVLEDDELRATIRKLAREGTQTESQLWRQAERYFDEMAANFHGSYFAILEVVFNRIWPRLFQGVEYSGLDKVAECVKQHPVVLVPCHRSHFDYLVLSYLFHLNYLSPPHIAAGINLSFWPLGPLFRGAGAFFIRRTFEGNVLYKQVFQKYLTFLIREGYTQEFFIEGGRSRTGKILTPKLGMLSAIVDAFVEGVRRDLYLVPVSIHYGRVVEEDAYQRELGGGEKEPETLRGLLKARKVLRRRHGTVYITFAEPISLNQALGPRKELFRVNREATEDDQRRFVQKLGFRLLREVNAAAVGGATSVSATVLLGLPHAACRKEEFVTRALALTDFLGHENIRFTASLERNVQASFRENIAFLESGGLIRRLAGDDDVIHIPAEKRLALDFYKNNTIHFFLLPALLIEALSRGVQGGALKDDVLWWLDLFRWEFPLPEREEIAATLGKLMRYCEQREIIQANNSHFDLRPEHAFVRSTIGILDNFRESYWIAAHTLAALPEGATGRKQVLERMSKRYAAGLLLGEVRKPEGNSSMTLGNALSRYAELGCVRVRPGKGREQLIERGEQFADLPAIAERISPRVVQH